MSSPPQFSYILPTDADERQRLDEQHPCFTLTFGGLYYPPSLVETVLSTRRNSRHAIIDIGTGSGAWAEDMARAFPAADVTGVDIVPPVSTVFTPPNCRFRFEDVNEGFSHYEMQYSIAQMRLISHGVEDFRGALHNVAQIIEPGGVLLVGSATLDAYDIEKKSIPVLKEGEPGWCAFRAILNVIQAVEGKKFEVNACQKWLQLLRDDNLYESSNVGCKMFHIPIGPWGSGKPGHSPSEVEAGRIMRESFKKIFPIWADIIIKDGALDSATMHRWLEAVMKEMEEMKPPYYMSIVMIWAKRSLVQWVNKSKR